LLCQDLMGEDKDAADSDECTERGLTLCHDPRGNAHSMPEQSG